MLTPQTGNQKVESVESLRNSRELLKQFASHLQAVREREKVDLSDELHDSLAQNLTGLKIFAHRILHNLNSGNSEEQIDSIKQQVMEMIEVIDSTLQGVKKIARETRPRILDDFGLVPAIELLIREVTTSRGVQFELIKETHEIDIKKIFCLEVFRILQEAISHVICQSGTTLLKVTISEKPDSYTIGILDNASGQNETDFLERNSIPVLGLYERTRLFGGNLQFIVDEAWGVSVILSIPKNDAE